MLDQSGVCVVLASDAGFFYQTRAAIESIRRANQQLDVRLITIGPYPSEALQWLSQQRVTVHDRIDDIPRFNGAPSHAVALSCRPYLPQIFSDVVGIVWMDSDVRILQPSGLHAWLAQAADPKCPVALCQETEPCYCINQLPQLSLNYHCTTRDRLRTVWGDERAEYLAYYKMFNAGVFAMPVASPVWEIYRRNLERSLAAPYDRMREQDALNMAILETGVRPLPCTMNWLCSLAVPVKGAEGQWLTPDQTGREILVAHLTNSDNEVTRDGHKYTFYECYRNYGLTT